MSSCRATNAKRADLVALAIERRDLMAPCDRDWRLPEYAPTTHRIDGAYGSFLAARLMRERLNVIDAAIGVTATVDLERQRREQRP